MLLNSKSTKNYENKKEIFCKNQGYKFVKSNMLEIRWRIKN